jgi:hypothetical protein
MGPAMKTESPKRVLATSCACSAHSSDPDLDQNDLQRGSSAGDEFPRVYFQDSSALCRLQLISTSRTLELFGTAQIREIC